MRIVSNILEEVTGFIPCAHGSYNTKLGYRILAHTGVVIVELSEVCKPLFTRKAGQTRRMV